MTKPDTFVRGTTMVEFIQFVAHDAGDGVRGRRRIVGVGPNAKAAIADARRQIDAQKPKEAR